MKMHFSAVLMARLARNPPPLLLPGAWRELSLKLLLLLVVDYYCSEPGELGEPVTPRDLVKIRALHPANLCLLATARA
jgi:hypothetical protein